MKRYYNELLKSPANLLIVVNNVINDVVEEWVICLSSDMVNVKTDFRHVPKKGSTSRMYQCTITYFGYSWRSSAVPDCRIT